MSSLENDIIYHREGILEVDDNHEDARLDAISQSSSHSANYGSRPIRSCTPTLRHRSRSRTNERLDDDDFVFLDTPENEVEAQKMEQNYMFGFKKWKSHLTKRPLQERSSVVQELYKDPQEIKPFTYPTIGVCNVLYTVLIGWLIALVYILVGALMCITVVAWTHGIFCFRLAVYFCWPFGYFVQEETEYRLSTRETVTNSETEVESVVNSLHGNLDPPHDEALLSTSSSVSSPVSGQSYTRVNNSGYWRKPSTYVWLVIGVPLLFLLHAIVIFITWMTVFMLPVSKLNMIAIKRLMLLPPEKLKVSETTAIKPGEHPHEVIMCTYEAVNFYSYKYTVDGMNIFLVNMLVFVIIAIVVGFADQDNTFTTASARFIMGLLAIIPLAHYIGMGITSISAQSSHVVGAVINATFGSIVEIVLYVSSLLKQAQGGSSSICYSEIIKSALTGTLLVTMLFIPGICMMVGGLKHKEQRFNVRSISVSSTLLFISVTGAFTPTIFTMTLGGFECNHCLNSTNASYPTLQCYGCSYVYLMDKDTDFLQNKLRPLIYVCITLLFLSYIIGLVFSLMTHSHIIQESGLVAESQGQEPEVLWGRIKSMVILLVAVVLMSLSAEVVSQNLEPILSDSTVFKPAFIGVTVLAVVPDLPEIINGIQFALKNNINLSLEIGCCVAVQVCLLQIPVLVVIDAIHPLGFNLVFNDLQLWSVVISVIIINYIFVDGKSDYFQGCMLCIIYFFLLAMFFFAGDATKTDCSIM